MVASSNTRKIVKKKTSSFPRFHSDRWKRVKASWRKPKGIDSRVRRKFKGNILMPSIGYGSNKKTKHMLPDGFYKFQVKNVADLEMLLMHNEKYAAEIASAVSAKNRKEIIERAQQLNVKVVNKSAKHTATENE